MISVLYLRFYVVINSGKLFDCYSLVVFQEVSVVALFYRPGDESWLKSKLCDMYGTENKFSKVASV
jgi:hypothetical protein